MVDIKSVPPGFKSFAHKDTTAEGSGTCSSISMHVITSKIGLCFEVKASREVH